MDYDLSNNLAAINKSLALWEYLIQPLGQYGHSANSYTSKNNAYRRLWDSSYTEDQHGCPLCEHSFMGTVGGCDNCPAINEWLKYQTPGSYKRIGFACEHGDVHTPWMVWNSNTNSIKHVKAMLKLLLRSREDVINNRCYDRFEQLEIGIGYTKRYRDKRYYTED